MFSKLSSIIKSMGIASQLAIFFLFLVGLMLIFWPVLNGENLFNDSYVTNYAVGQTGYNFYKDFGNSLRQGHLQLWWSNYLAGFPTYLTQTGFFNPIGIVLFHFLDYILAYNWLIFLNFLFAGLAMYWFIRNLKLSKSAAILAGFAWALSFNNIQYGSIPIFSNTYLFIPLFFGAIMKLSQGDKKYLFFGVLISVYGLIAGFTTLVFYTFVSGLAWALFLDGKKYFGKAVRGYVIVSFIGAVLASIWLLPVLNYMPLTLRGQAISSPNFYDYLKIGDAIRFFYPFIQLPGFSGFTLLSGVANLYTGVIPLFLAIIAMFLCRRNSAITFWFGLFLFAFSMRLWFFPILQWIQYLPLFNRFKAPFHWYTLAFFSLAILSAYGLDYINEIKNSRWFSNFVKVSGIFAALNIFVALAANLTVKFFRSSILNFAFKYFDNNIYSPAKKYPIDYYHEIISLVFDKSAASFSLFNYQFLISFIFIIFGASLFILYHTNYLNFEKFRILAVAIAVFNLVLIWQGYYNFTSKKLITNSPDTISYIQKLPNFKNFRVFRLYPPEMYQKFGFYDLKNPDDYDIQTLGLQINTYWVDGLGGGENLRSYRISKVLNEIGYEIPSTYNDLVWIKSNDLTLTQKISRFSSPQNLNILSMLNVKYLFSSFKLPNLKLIYETTATEKNIPVYIYENSEAMPRIYFAKNVKFVEPEKSFEELLKVNDFHELTLIEATRDKKQETRNGKILAIETFEPQLVRIKTQGEGWLVYSDANLPTWEAYVDGNPIPIYTANYLFKSVFVPEGKHDVVFKYPGLWEQFKYAFKNLIFNF